ncbi:Hypothetical predicted protein [Prunus dulcis]|uniref:Uncharacterized protein n=1 Tax=Prunus dulcis TaxID=3755 RepID=A0A5E4F7Z3_PRUDU|nr:Hypothetical predicted protein [Prunus dulcis]
MNMLLLMKAGKWSNLVVLYANKTQGEAVLGDRHGGLLCNPLEPPITCLMGNSKELPHFVQQQQLLRGATHHLTGNSKELPHFEQQQQLLHGAAHHLLDGKLADNLDC